MSLKMVYRSELDPNFRKEGNAYWICCGALNSFNASGDFYVFTESIKELFLSNKSRFGVLLKEGLLGGEAEHPNLASYKDNYERAARTNTIDPSRRSHNILGIEFKETNNISLNKNNVSAGGNIVKIYCLIEPLDNELGRTLRSMIESGGNVAFSIRTYADDVLNKQTGIIEAIITNPITFDWVTRGGIGTASKDVTHRHYAIENDLSKPMLVRYESLLNIDFVKHESQRAENHNVIEELAHEAKEYYKTKESKLTNFLNFK